MTCGSSIMARGVRADWLGSPQAKQVGRSPLEAPVTLGGVADRIQVESWERRGELLEHRDEFTGPRGEGYRRMIKGSAAGRAAEQRER